MFMGRLVETDDGGPRSLQKQVVREKKRQISLLVARQGVSKTLSISSNASKPINLPISPFLDLRQVLVSCRR